MKKFLLSITMVFMPIIAEAVEIENIYYNLVKNEKRAEVTSNPNRYSGSVVIPEKVEYEGTEYSVTMIGKEAFMNCNTLTSITIPNSVTIIANSAFCGCI